MINIKTTLQAGQMQEYYGDGDFLRVMEASEKMTITYFKNGAEVARAVDVGEGYAERFLSKQFDRVTVVSSATQTVDIVVRLGNEVLYDKAPEGDVNILNVNGGFVHLNVTVNTTDTTLRNSKSDRRYLMVQNNHQIADIYVRLYGITPTITHGIKVEAGGCLEFQGFVPTGEIVAVSTVTNPNVIVVEA